MLGRNLFIGLFCVLGTAVQAQYTIPDPSFALRLQQIVPNAMNGNVLDTNHVDVTSRTVLYVQNAGISDLSGVQFFDSLEYLICRDNQLASLPPLPASLLELDCNNNHLTSLPSLPATLTWLDCSGNQLTSLPPLPASLSWLDCHVNQLASLPSLPTSLDNLDCRDNQLASLPPLPASLLELDCSGNQLTSLPSLPTSLQELYCNQNQLTSLPFLPASLTRLVCGSNQLTSLTPLPVTLERLFCETNQLTSLPSLPTSLQELYCYQNQLTSLPLLPTSLQELYCYLNQLTSLPSLPPSLQELRCRNNELSCLPNLPGSLNILQCQDNAINCMPNFPVGLPPFGAAANLSNLGFVPVLCSTSDPCFPAEVISGIVFNDANGNGILDVGEGPFFNGIGEAQPGNYIGGIDIYGNYALPVDLGSYTVQGQPVLYHAITTPIYAVTITAGMSDTANHIGYQIIPGVYDLVADIQGSVTRPGFDNNVWLEVENIGTEPTIANIDLDFDADQTFVSSSVVPASQSGTNVNWSVTMNPGDVWSATVTLNTDATIALGTPIDHLFAAIPASTDTTPANNSTTWNDVVVGSYDPNDKTASSSALTPIQVQSGEWIEYLIRFQNTGTYLAEHVRITDTLSTVLQWNTFQYISSSHNNYWYLSNGTLVFQFDNIQLPDSNANEADSHGFVKFRIKPAPNLTVGDNIVNIANIFFDFNEPVITEPCMVLIDVVSGVGEAAASDVQIFPNPTSGVLNIVSDQVIESLQLYSSDGRVLRTESVNGASHRIDVSGMEQGMYVLVLSTANGRKVQRVVVE